MKFSANRTTLLKPLKRVIGVVESHQVLPILSHIMLVVKDQQLRLIATNSEIQLEATVQLDEAAAIAGEITVPGRKLADICQALPEAANIRFSLEKDRLLIQTEHSAFNLATLPTSAFPRITPPTEASTHFTIAPQTLYFLTARAHFAMAQEDVRYFLNGLLLERTSSGALYAVAADGHRLALNHTLETEVSDPTHQPIQAIIPRKTVTELIRLLKEEQAPLTVSISDRHIYIQGSIFTLTSNLIEGQYPQYDQLIPEPGDIMVSLNCQALKAALTRAAILANKNFRGVRLQLRTGLLLILANNPEQESAEEKIAIHYDGADIDVGFNISYLLDILATVTTDEILMAFCGPKHTALIKEPENPHSTFVVMPVTL